jgi:predicted NBD/HSP70 family sugar kinase
VSSLVTELIDQSLVRELGQGESGGGKPPTLLALNERAREIVAVDLGHQPFTAALVDLSGSIHERAEARHTNISPSGREALEIAVDLITRVISSSTVNVLGIGVGSPGVVSSEGRVLEAFNLDWHSLDLSSDLKTRFGLPVVVANDAAMAALGEFRQDPDERNLMLVKLGRGVGAGLVLGGRLYRGQHSAAGEIGHVRAEEDGTRCACGRWGCLETVASVPAIMRRFGADPEHDPWDASELAVAYGQDAVQSAIRVAGRAVGAAVAGAVATLDVGHVVLTSEMENAADTLAAAARVELRDRILPSSADRIDVEASRVDEDLVLSGAASAVLVESFGAVL